MRRGGEQGEGALERQDGISGCGRGGGKGLECQDGADAGWIDPDCAETVGGGCVLRRQIGDGPQERIANLAEERPAAGRALGEAGADEDDGDAAVMQRGKAVRPELAFGGDAGEGTRAGEEAGESKPVIEGREGDADARVVPPGGQAAGGRRVDCHMQAQGRVGCQQPVDERADGGDLADRGGVQPDRRVFGGGDKAEPLGQGREAARPQRFGCGPDQEQGEGEGKQKAVEQHVGSAVLMSGFFF